MAVLLIALVITIALEGFLVFLTTEYRSVHRTYSYGSAIYLAEAGVEEGMAMINYGNSSWSANGWSSLGSDNYTKTLTSFTSSDGGAIGRYTVNVLSATNSNPVIVCTGIVDEAYATVAGQSNTNITRAVKAILGKRAIFQWGLLAQSTIDLNGNNAELDSYDSADPSHSDWQGSYGTYDPDERKDNGDAATNAGITNSIAAGNANIYGHVATGAGGTVSVGPNGFVGSLTTHPNGEIQPDRISSSMNVDLPLPTVPFTSGSTISSITDDYFLVGGFSSTPSDKIITGNITLNNDEVLYCWGYMRIHVQGNVSLTGNAKIYIYSGAKVELYVSGSISLAGNGVENDAEVAEKFQVYNLGYESTSIAGNGEFTGVVYAPGSAVSISGNGTVNGAVVGNTITLDGNAEFHYDEALKNTGPSRGYSILAWQEL